MRTLVALLNYAIRGVIEDIEKILPLHYTETTPTYRPPQGHTLTLTVGPESLDHDWRCHEPMSAPCREGREESDGCLYIERIKDSHIPWYRLTLDGVPEEFPPLQVAFVERSGEMYWYDPSFGS